MRFPDSVSAPLSGYNKAILISSTAFDAGDHTSMRAKNIAIMNTLFLISNLLNYVVMDQIEDHYDLNLAHQKNESFI
jgi:hypothetical protein